MKELFESTMDNVSELEVRGYSDPVNMERTMEILVKRGDEEYLYKFTGPGVDEFVFEADGRCWKENEKLREENKKLGHADMLDKAAADYWSKEHDILLERLNKLQEEKEKLDDEQKEESMRLKEENKHLREDIMRAKDELHSLKQEKSKIPMVDDCLKLSKEIEKLTFEKEMMRKANIKLKKELVPQKESPSSRSDILKAAEKCVCGQREQDYGSPESNFQLIADLWNGYLGFMDHPQDQIRATDVAMMMALLKIARIKNGGGSGDSFVDLAGYAACGGEIWHGERHSST